MSDVDEILGSVTSVLLIDWPSREARRETCEYRAGGDDLSWLGLRIAMLGVDFDVREPPELVEHLRALASRLARRPVIRPPA